MEPDLKCTDSQSLRFSVTVQAQFLIPTRVRSGTPLGCASAGSWDALQLGFCVHGVPLVPDFNLLSTTLWARLLSGLARCSTAPVVVADVLKPHRAGVC